MKRDRAFRVHAGQVAEEAATISKACAKRALEAGGYHGMDVFTKIGIDVTRCNLEDPMHLIGNNVEHIFGLGMDSGANKFTLKRRTCEVKLDRFPELDVMPVEDRCV